MYVPRSLATACVSSWALLLLTIAPAGAAPRRLATPLHANDVDLARRLDVNRLNLVVTNLGSFGFDIATGSGGLIFPKGSAKRALFAGGLWLSTSAQADTLATVAEYAMEYGPGAMVSGTFDDPSRPEYRVYKVARWTGDPADSSYVDRTPAELAADPDLDPLLHHSWSEYLAGAAPYGAPTRMYRLPDSSTADPSDSVDVLGPDVLGDAMLWAIYNDADPSRHQDAAGSTAPLGVEVRQTTFAYNRVGPLQDLVFLRFQIVNRGVRDLTELVASVWSDPDLGDAVDDLSGYDPARSMGFGFNGTNTDAIYGSTPPAVGFDLLAPIHFDPETGFIGGAAAFQRYINGTDPASASQSYWFARGFGPGGEPIINPVTGNPTTFMVSGDPVQGTGWLDGPPSDKRTLISAPPIHVAPGDSIELWAVLGAGLGTDRLSSVSALRCADDYAQTVFGAGFHEPLPAPVTCQTALACPRRPDWWAGQCAFPGEITPELLSAIAGHADFLSTLFDWSSGPPESGMCATLSPPGSLDARQRARREYAGLLANVSAWSLALAAGQTPTIGFSLGTPVHCPSFPVSDIAGLIAPAEANVGLVDARYLNDNLANRRAIEGVDFGLPRFNGGAGVMSDFFGSTLDAAASPDSFSSVRLEFDHTATQLAYRFLRLERMDGSAPPQGRFYQYAGYHEVPFRCLEIATGDQLEVAFVERALTDDDGNLLPPEQQLPTYDATWGPDDSPIGGREYLFVLHRPYSKTPNPAIAIDGLPSDGLLPATFVLTARLRSPVDVIDDGDKFEFIWGRPPAASADSRLFELELRSLADPEVVAAYDSITECLGAINRGEGIGPTCGDPTPVLASLLSAFAEPGRIELEWAALEAGANVTVERRSGDTDWAPRASVNANGQGRLQFEDRDVTSGTRYGYRLSAPGAGGVVQTPEVWLEVPSASTLSFAGLSPNPASAVPAARFTLPSRGRVAIELLDVSGRRWLLRELGVLEPGAHVVTLTETKRLPAGVYLARLTHGRDSVTRRFALVR